MTAASVGDLLNESSCHGAAHDLRHALLDPDDERSPRSQSKPKRPGHEKCQSESNEEDQATFSREKSGYVFPAIDNLDWPADRAHHFFRRIDLERMAQRRQEVGHRDRMVLYLGTVER